MDWTYHEGPRRVKGVLELLERGKVNQSTGLARRDPGLEEHERDDEAPDLNETDGPYGPREADPGQELPDHAGEHEAAGRAAARRDAHDEGPLLLPVRRDDGHGRAEEEPVAEAEADALREEQLPVLRAHGRREDAERHEGDADGHHWLEEAGVREAAGEGADEEEEEDLDGSDP